MSFGSLVSSAAAGDNGTNPVVTGTFIPAHGSNVAVPWARTPTTTFGFQAQIARGQVLGTISISAKVGDAKKQLIDTCSALPITFRALS